MHANFDGALADAEMSCQFAEFKFLTKTQLVEDPGHGRHPCHDLLQTRHQRLGGFLSAGAFVRGWSSGPDHIAIFERREQQMRPPPVIQSQASADDEQPGAEAVLGLEQFQAAPGPHEGFLTEIESIMFVPQQSPQMPHHPRLMPMDQLSETIAVPPLRSCNQLGIWIDSNDGVGLVQDKRALRAILRLQAGWLPQSNSKLARTQREGHEFKYTPSLATVTAKIV